MERTGDLVLGADGDDAVLIDVHGHFQLRHSPFCNLDTFKLEVADG